MSKLRERVRVVYVTQEYVTAITKQLDIAAAEFYAARDDRAVAAEILGLRRAAFLDCIERLKAAVLGDHP